MDIYFSFLKALFLFLTELLEFGSVTYFEQKRNDLFALWV